MNKLPTTFQELIELIKDRYSIDGHFMKEFENPDDLEYHVKYMIRYDSLGGEVSIKDIVHSLDHASGLNYLTGDNVKTEGFEVFMESFKHNEDGEEEDNVGLFYERLDDEWFSHFDGKE